jgi:hypothetical protein
MMVYFRQKENRLPVANLAAIVIISACLVRDVS